VNLRKETDIMMKFKMHKKSTEISEFVSAHC